MCVHPSVCPSICNVNGKWSHRRKMLETNCAKNWSNIFTLCRLKDDAPNTEKFWGWEHKKTTISLKCVKIEEKLLSRAFGKSSTLFRFFRLPPYFYFRFCFYGHRDGRFCLIFDRTAQQSVIDGTNGLSSGKPCVYCVVTHIAW